MGWKAKVVRAGSAMAQVMALGPLSAFTIPAADAALSHTEQWYDKKHSDDQDKDEDN